MDEQIQLYDVPEGKVYKTGHMALATFFGGLLVGAYLLAANFKTLGNKQAVVITWVSAVALFVGAAVAQFFIPAFSSIPAIAYAALFAFLVTWAGRRFQLKKINQHLDLGGGMHSTGNVVAVTLIGLAALVLLVFFIQDSFIGRF